MVSLAEHMKYNILPFCPNHNLAAGNFKSASHYSELSCKAVEAVLGSDSVELGNELHKLALLFFNR